MPEKCIGTFLVSSIMLQVCQDCVCMYIYTSTISSHSVTIHLIQIFLRNDLRIFFAVAVTSKSIQQAFLSDL